MPGPAALLAAGARRLSWAQVLWLSREALKRGSAIGRELGPNGRARMVELVRKSNGRPGNLTARERDELRRLAMQVWDAAVHPEKH
ncbi:MAG TPA: hypothetical protein VFY99_00900 [Solirubrobacterales bacterium]